MAETVDDDTTSDNPLWFLDSELAWLASRELAFVHERIGEAAKKYLRGLLTKFEFMSGWYAELEIEGDLLPTSFPAARRALWNDRDYPGVEWGPSRAVYVGPAIRLHKNPDGSESVVFDRRASVRITAELIRFRHSWVARDLRSRGLMRRPGLVVEPVIAEAPAPVTMPTVTEVETKPKLSRKGLVPRKLLPKAQRITWEVLRHEWPPDGMAALDVSTAELEPQVKAGWMAARKRLGLEPNPPAEHLRSTINRALGRLRDRK